MPRISSLSVTSNSVTVIAAGTTRTFAKNTVPVNGTAAQAEAFVDSWLASNVSEAQGRCHVITLSPLNIMIGFFNLGATIPSNWWADG